jgi:hypothetical protein
MGLRGKLRERENGVNDLQLVLKMSGSFVLLRILKRGYVAS